MAHVNYDSEGRHVSYSCDPDCDVCEREREFFTELDAPPQEGDPEHCDLCRKRASS